MAHVLQTARKSTGGKAPRKQLRSRNHEPSSKVIQDHTGNDVTLAWVPNAWDKSDVFPPFGYQVYLTNTGKKTALVPDFPLAFAQWIEKLGRIGDGNALCHFEVYSKPFRNVLDCVAHQRKEVAWRNRNGLFPRMVSTWNNGTPTGYAGFIIVVDSDDWQEEGIIFVSFNPVEYLVPGNLSYFDLWDQIEGDIDVIRATKESDIRSVTPQLKDRWTNAGHEWTQDDLQRRNNGGFSPALYPAIDPASHADADGDGLEAFDTAIGGELVNANIATLSLDDDQIDQSRIKDTFHIDDLWQPASSFTKLRAETYTDDAGQDVTSVWHNLHGGIRPDFAVTLYLMTSDKYAPEAIFDALNSGLLKETPWTLDVVQVNGPLSDVLEHHTRESYRRSPERHTLRSECTAMLLRKVIGDALPAELIEYIEQLIVPPQIKNYSSQPTRHFQRFLMYLSDTPSEMSQGPQLVYSNPLPSHEHYLCPPMQEPKPGFAHSSNGSMQSPWSGRLHSEDTLRVVNLRFWNRVADEIHTLWSLCSPRSEEAPAQGWPWIELELHIPDVCTFDRRSFERTKTGISLVLQNSDGSIAVHTCPFFNLDLWEQALEIIDLATSTVLPDLPYKSTFFRDHSASWAQTPELGWRKAKPEAEDAGWGYRPRSLLPLTPQNMNMSADLWFWSRRSSARYFVDGHEYAIRLKNGVTVPRWTWGTSAEKRGPYNLPPIHVRMHREVRFVYREIQHELPGLFE